MPILKGFVNDKVIDCDNAQISAYDLGLNRAYAVFDFFRMVNGKFRFLEDHLDRFINSIQLSKIPNPYTKDELRNKILELQAVNKVQHGYIRITLTAGSSSNFGTLSTSTLIILSGILSVNNPSDYTEGIKLLSKNHQRTFPKIKSTDYFFPQMLHQELKESQATDVLYYTDYVTETSRANVFVVKNGEISTPKENILEGITRKKLLKMKPSITLADITIAELYDVDEVFITSSSKELMPVVQIDDKLIGNGKVGEVYKDLHTQFSKFCLKEN
ncbi:aminotransferase class IV [Aureibaculum sp. 2210JD6-5]|uniref:aminotransferase class IV n=1 Tax=Aureibaculum sp. 2210JD6-5 TaxID=3103957 RepID=UPI002AAEC9E5|nr:aminotransferase class IV [Aureibaculum sp. 2210JD6-5]MDY7395431.1 aminotransferase class IV [Aureibaculum sp. 2210JD6-5]